MAEQSTKISMPQFLPTAFAEMGQQRLDAAIAAQAELLDIVGEANQAWLDRARSEADLASELTRSLSAARSLPDATKAWQEWASKRMSLLAEDGRRLAADYQRTVAAGARLLNGAGNH